MNATVGPAHATRPRDDLATSPYGHTAPRPRDDLDTRAAWACLVAAPVAFVLAFVVGEGLSSLLGWDGVGPPDWWVGLLSVGAALVVFSIPAALATWCWSRARRRGDDRAKVPAVILVVASLGFLAMNLSAWVLGVVASNL